VSDEIVLSEIFFWTETLVSPVVKLQESDSFDELPSSLNICKLAGTHTAGAVNVSVTLALPVAVVTGFPER